MSGFAATLLGEDNDYLRRVWRDNEKKRSALPCSYLMGFEPMHEEDEQEQAGEEQ